MNVHPSSITPFLYTGEEVNRNNMTGIERALIDWGEKMQLYLIKDRSKKLQKYGK